MKKRIVFFRPMGINLVAAVILAACSAAGTPVRQASMTSTQAASPTPVVPTATATTVPSATDTPIPSVIATATAVPTPTTRLAAQVIPTLNAYCRKGPSTSYIQITFLQKGTPYNVTGRNSLNTWWLIQAPGNVSCWVGDANVDKQGPVEQAAIVQVQPLPGTPAQFVNSYKCNTTLKTLGVLFNWAAVDYVTGYRIYRDGSSLTEVGPTVTSYHDDAPMGEDLVYELEAFNDYGTAARISTTVPACK